MAEYLPQLLPVLIPLLVLALLWRRITRTRKVRVETLWIVPLIALIAAVAIVAFEPAPTPLEIAIQLVAVALGGALGWYRGAFTRLTVDPATHEVTSKASPIGVALILGAFMLRQALRAGLGGPNGYASQFHLNAVLLTDAFLLFAVAMVMVQRLEIWLRCRKLLAAARAAKQS